MILELSSGMYITQTTSMQTQDGHFDTTVGVKIRFLVMREIRLIKKNFLIEIKGVDRPNFLPKYAIIYEYP